MENCNHELVTVRECVKCRKTFDLIPPTTSDWEVLEKLEPDTLAFMVVDLQNGLSRHYEEGRRLMLENNELLEMEKDYASKLGRLAQLCDIVCGWVNEQTRTAFIPEDTLSAMNEIMDYVDAVRP